MSRVSVSVFWPRWSALRLREPRWLRPDGPAAGRLRVVLLRRADLPETLSREAALLRPFLYHIHLMVSPQQLGLTLSLLQAVTPEPETAGVNKIHIFLLI